MIGYLSNSEFLEGENARPLLVGFRLTKVRYFASVREFSLAQRLPSFVVDELLDGITVTGSTIGFRIEKLFFNRKGNDSTLLHSAVHDL